MTERLEGGCLCGAVRYAIPASALSSLYACHCTDCQTQTGSAFGLQIPVAEELFEISGALREARRTMPSGATGIIHACAECLTRIYAENASRPGLVIVRAGTLDTSSMLRPRLHFWVRSRQPWVVLPDDAMVHDSQPRSASQWREILGMPGETA